jgi:hypothetical protein
VLICCITGESFIAAREGVSVNYARDKFGNVYSNAGVDIAERETMRQRSGPVGCYISSEGNTVTGWKGNKLGDIVARGIGGGFGGKLWRVRVRDVHGGLWYGQGAGPGVCIMLRPMKGRKA